MSSFSSILKPGGQINVLLGRQLCEIYIDLFL